MKADEPRLIGRVIAEKDGTQVVLLPHGLLEDDEEVEIFREGDSAVIRPMGRAARCPRPATFGDGG